MGYDMMRRMEELVFDIDNNAGNTLPSKVVIAGPARFLDVDPPSSSRSLLALER
jgi:hypothetical protein